MHCLFLICLHAFHFIAGKVNVDALSLVAALFVASVNCQGPVAQM